MSCIMCNRTSFTFSKACSIEYTYLMRYLKVTSEEENCGLLNALKLALSIKSSIFQNVEELLKPLLTFDFFFKPNFTSRVYLAPKFTRTHFTIENL